MGGDDKFCLRWNDFQFSISQSFQEFREDLVDVTIFCGKKKVLKTTSYLFIRRTIDMLFSCSRLKLIGLFSVPVALYSKS